MRKFIIPSLIALLAASPGAAGVVLDPVSATTNMGSYSSQYLPVDAINQSALFPSGYVSGVTDFDSYVASAHVCSTSNFCEGASSFNIWFSQSGTTTGNFNLDLGSLQTVQALALWNDPQTVGQGVNGFQLYASNDAGFAGKTLLGSFTAAEGNQYAQVFSFSSTAARYFQLQINSNHGSTLTTGISELAFEGVSAAASAAPEPSSWALMVGGFGLVGGALRVRRRPAFQLA